MRKNEQPGFWVRSGVVLAAEWRRFFFIGSTIILASEAQTPT